MNTQARLCALCGGEMEPGTTTFSADFTMGVVVVREVPALVCAQCGESWIEDEVAVKLEIVVNDSRRRQATVEVANWQRVAV